MRLRAQIIVEITADDYIEAAEHQRHLGMLLEGMRERYPDAKLVMRERRERGHPEEVAPPTSRLLSLAKAGRT